MNYNCKTKQTLQYNADGSNANKMETFGYFDNI